MERLVLIGGGGHCKSVLDAALRIGKYSEIVITDPFLKKDTQILGCQVIGDDSILPELYRKGYEYAFISVGCIKEFNLRKRLAYMAESIGFRFPTIIDPSAIISPYTKIAEGTFVGKQVVINADAKVGKHCIINTGSLIEHECRVGRFSHVSVGAILCGDSSVGEESLVGAGSTIIQNIEIGNRVIIGAGSTVLRDVLDGEIVYGIVDGKKNRA